MFSTALRWFVTFSISTGLNSFKASFEHFFKLSFVTTIGLGLGLAVLSIPRF